MSAPRGIPTPAPQGPNLSRAERPPGGVIDVDIDTGAASDALPVLINRQRAPLALDPFGPAGEILGTSIVPVRTLAAANLYLGIGEVKQSLTALSKILAAPSAPPQLIGVLLQPDGTAARRVQLEFDPTKLGLKSPKVTVHTDDSGAFTLPLPQGLTLPLGGTLDLRAHGANSNAIVQIANDQIATNGLVGAVPLPGFVNPLPVSILAALQALVAPPSTSTPPPVPDNPPQLPVIRIGDEEGCLLTYGMNHSFDRFPFGVFYRLVEPRASIVTQARSHPVGGGKFTFLPNYVAEMSVQTQRPAEPVPALPGALPAVPPDVPGEGDVTYVERVPVEQPISVDGFRDQMMGLLPNGTFTANETRPMAGTLGLGYVLWLAQRWTFQGLALGDLVYSLPLAPGEQQRIAIFERTDVARVSESEFFSQAEVEQQIAISDTSTEATFTSAFNEAVHGRSSFSVESDSSSWGGSLILISGGGGSSSSSGSTSQSLQGHRDTAQQAAQTTHSAAQRQASARRTASRTGMRLASTSETQQITTRVITNHNHTRALTMQYWEVQRLYDVTTAIEGLTLTVLVPLQVVRFMPPGQPATLASPNLVDTRAEVLARYRAIVKHGDVLAKALPRRLRHGLTMLLQFAADPTAEVEAAGGAAEDVIQLSLSGTFVPYEDVTITAVTDRQTRVGPVRLANPLAPPPDDEFTTREQLLEWFLNLRQGSATAMTGALALPPTMNRSNVIGFEISRSFRQVPYTLVSEAAAELKVLQDLFGASNDWINQAIESTLAASATKRQTITLTPNELENELNGPQLYTFSAHIVEVGGASPTPQEQYANESLMGIELPPQPYPVPARQLSPVLRYNEVLEIEQMAQHVVRNTLTYSRAIWASMSPDERAVLLEAYTIGVPADGIADATQMVPLLNCVENRVLGYFGNSMIMPFIIPQSLAREGFGDGDGIDPAEIHEALLAYQIATFTPPHSIISLPTRGVLGEAVLGHCASAEKIDLTRFWNWQDSPPDVAPAIEAVTLPTTTPSPAAGLSAPNSLTGLPSLINNVLNAPTPDTALLQSLAQASLGQKGFDPSLTGAAQLAGLISSAQSTANAARADALKTTKDLTAQAMATVGNIVGAKKGNPEAGSKAASAVLGTGGSQPAGAATTQPTGTAQQGGGKVQTPTGTTGTPTGTTGTPTGGATGPTGGPSGPPPPPPVVPGGNGDRS